MRKTASGFAGPTWRRDTIALQMPQISERKRELLRRVVEEHVTTGEPVGSTVQRGEPKWCRAAGQGADSHRQCCAGKRSRVAQHPTDTSDRAETTETTETTET